MSDDGRHDAHFRTDHLMADLKGRSMRGGAVTLAAQGAKFTLQVGSTMVLARLLTPADFGLVAMVTAVTGLVALLKDAGLSMATVQREHITHAQVSTLFWINVALSLAVMLVIAALAPVIARFYGEPRLVPITVALAGTFVFGGFTVQHQALLRRQMKFRALAVIEILSLATGVATAIGLALRGFGYWSLVGLPAATAAANCALVWRASRWRPGRPVRGSGVGAMLWFGGHLTGFNLINYFNRNLDNILLGHYLGAGPLGVYSKAYSLLLLPLREINGPASAVLLPALSRLQTEPGRFRRAYLRAVELLGFAGLGIVGITFASAPELVRIVLGEGWDQAALIFRCLFLAAVAAALNVLPGWLFLALGRADRQLKWIIPGSIPILGGIIAGLPWGVTGVAVGCSLGYMLSWTGATWYASRGTPVTFNEILTQLRAPVCCMLMGLGIAMLLRQSAPFGPLPMGLRFLLVCTTFVLGWGLVFVLLCPHLIPRNATQLKDAIRSFQGKGTR